MKIDHMDLNPWSKIIQISKKKIKQQRINSNLQFMKRFNFSSLSDSYNEWQSSTEEDWEGNVCPGEREGKCGSWCGQRQEVSDQEFKSWLTISCQSRASQVEGW